MPLFHVFALLKLPIITFWTMPKLVVPPGATADTQTNHMIGLGHTLIQNHHTGLLPSPASLQDSLPALPLSDPLAAMSMPEAWVRGTILVRINSLIRGHSAVCWELLENTATLLHEDITPCVPLRGSILVSEGTSVY
jgi:phenylalanine ammonia-lyase